MITRTSRYHVLKMLEESPNLSVVDLGSGNAGSCPDADVLVDRADFSASFPDKQFIVHDLNNLPLPFEDHEFDFSFCSHLLEHMTQPLEFLKEVVRISKSGYIEVPSPLIDNLVSGDDYRDPYGHKWWVFFDDVGEKIILRPRRHIVEKTIDIPELNKLYPFFRSSFVIELMWSRTMEIEMGDEKYFYENSNYDLSRDTINPWKMGH
tara:strand:+ start:9278 stop:9898 length:621 start_codon:yes stop_codon:yes gene_type:complete